MSTQSAIRINEIEVSPVVVRGQRVLTFAMVDKIHGRSEGTAKRNFTENKARLTEGEDYFLVRHSQKDELRTFGIEVPPRGLTVVTESGYLLLVKSFTDDLAWKVQKELVGVYFRAKEARYSAMRHLDEAIAEMEADKAIASKCGMALARWKKIRKEHIKAVETATRRAQLLLGF
ncbi:ORF11CD3 domain-containing protein [Azotobacter beijerinckii]|uniref:ORF11CD3 domain-containing protein n=1 Tax=Azotobacter beijerinckii TaxID=170623 RepID=A0A1H6V6K1_9GAMM|nr:ORF6N domain-containing protein [Azotobacter beijerinckii]SEI98574.1 ORF11CD3 domain-containing protein [Azotobacter beijerinckii]